MDATAPPAAIDAQLVDARRRVSAGEGEQAIAAAVEVLNRALDAGDFALQGEAMHCMAVAELRLLGRFDRALDLSERAALCHQRVHNDAGESAALAVHAIAAVRLGRHERAMESALLAVRLAESVNERPRLVMAYQALGVAAYSGRNFDESRNAYQRAIRHAAESTPPLNPFELHVDLASTEAFLYFTERGFSGRRLSLDGLARHVGEAERLLGDGARDISLTPGSHANNLRVHLFTSALLAVWTGDGTIARCRARFLAAARASARPWYDALLHWIDGEVALAEERLDVARANAQDMIRIGLAHSHETITANGYNLLSHACRKQGDLAAALEALLALTRREQAARAEGLKTRVAVIEWQMDLRRQERRMEVLESDSRLFEKLAMEDALTGLANRRALEAHLRDRLPVAEGAPPVAIALVDVDRFKQVNDQHSHHVGDEVLKAVAGLFRRNLRDSDVAARLAGDEFVLVLPATTQHQAEELRARLLAAVAAHPWASLSPGLQVSLSIGVVLAKPGESFEEALARSDTAMYEAKRAPAIGAMR